MQHFLSLSFWCSEFMFFEQLYGVELLTIIYKQKDLFSLSVLVASL